MRRGFWLSLGAVAGVAGYRRTCAAVRRLSAVPGAVNGRGGPGPVNGRGGRGGPGAVNVRGGPGPRSARSAAARLAGEAIRFTRDVREGMELYMARRSAPAPPTLSTDRSHHRTRPEDGR
jgi:hypothetical protein